MTFDCRFQRDMRRAEDKRKAIGTTKNDVTLSDLLLWNQTHSTLTMLPIAVYQGV